MTTNHCCQRFIGARVACLTATLFVLACGSTEAGSGGSKGQLLDGAVSGIDFESGTQSGTTDSRGTFYYDSGETVTFWLGDIAFPELEPADVVTPLDMVPGAVDESHPTVVNIVRFLLSLDSDSTPSNGIQIPADVARLARGLSLDFSDRGSVDTTLSALVAGSPVSDREAMDHFHETLLCLVAGRYAGSWASDSDLRPQGEGDGGNWTIEVDRQGNLLGTVRSDFGDQTLPGFIVSGTVDTSGAVMFQTSQPGLDLRFTGEASDGIILGVWQDSILEDGGSFSGVREITEDCTPNVG